MAETPRLRMMNSLRPGNLDCSACALPPGAERVHFYLGDGYVSSRRRRSSPRKQTRGSDPGSPTGRRPAAPRQPQPHAATEEPDSGRPGASRRCCPHAMNGLRPPPAGHFYFAENRTFLNWFGSSRASGKPGVLRLRVDPPKDSPRAPRVPRPPVVGQIPQIRASASRLVGYMLTFVSIMSSLIAGDRGE